MFKKAKKKIRLYKRIVHEVLETLVTICIHITRLESNYYRRSYPHLDSHARQLKSLADELREDIRNESQKSYRPF